MVERLSNLKRRLQKLENAVQAVSSLALTDYDIALLRSFIIDRLENFKTIDHPYSINNRTPEEIRDYVISLTGPQVVAEAERLWKHPSGLSGLMEAIYSIFETKQRIQEIEAREKSEHPS